MTVIVTVTQPGVTVTATPTSLATSNVSAGAIAGIVIGTLVGGILLITLVWYLLSRYSRPKFTRVANPGHDPISSAQSPDMRYLPRTVSKSISRHIQKPSVSSEPLLPPVSLPPLSFMTSPAQSPGTCRSIASDTTAHLAVTASLDVPLHEQTSLASLRLGESDPPPAVPQSSHDDARTPPATPKTQQSLFIHRMLQSRAKASEDTSSAHRLSLDISQSLATITSAWVDQERLLVEAERTALQDAQTAQKEGGRTTPEEEVDMESSESTYSQLSAPVDHSAFLSQPTSPQNSSLSLPRRKSSRRHRAPVALPAELPPVAEVSDISSSLEGRSHSHPKSTAANSSLDVQASHGTRSRPISSVFDPSGPMPLLTSTNFGKDSSGSGTPPGSISSATGWASSSNGRSSRYPSLAASSIGQSSRSGPRSDGGIDWNHTPSGLAGLASLQIGSLTNPHSPVEERPEEPNVLLVPPVVDATQVKRARLREGTSSSIPEVERSTVMQGGIAHIDVAL